MFNPDRARHSNQADQDSSVSTISSKAWNRLIALGARYFSTKVEQAHQQASENHATIIQPCGSIGGRWDH